MYLNNSTHIRGQVSTIQVFAPQGQLMIEVDDEFTRSSLVGRVALVLDEYALAIQAVNAADEIQWLFSREMSLIELESVLDSSDFRDVHLQLEVEFTVNSFGYGQTGHASKLLLRNGARGEVI